MPILTSHFSVNGKSVTVNDRYEPRDLCDVVRPDHAVAAQRAAEDYFDAPNVYMSVSVGRQGDETVVNRLIDLTRDKEMMRNVKLAACVQRFTDCLSGPSYHLGIPDLEANGANSSDPMPVSLLGDVFRLIGNAGGYAMDVAVVSFRSAVSFVAACVRSVWLRLRGLA